MKRLFITYKSLTLSLLFIFLFSVTVSFASPLYNSSNTTLDPQCAPSDTDCVVQNNFFSGDVTFDNQISQNAILKTSSTAGSLLLISGSSNRNGPALELYGRDYVTNGLAGYTFLTFGGHEGQGAFILRHYDGTDFVNDLRVDQSGNITIGNANYDSQYRLDVLNNTTNQVLSNRVFNVANTAATFNTTAGSLISYGGYFSSNSTRAAGTNDLTNIALYASASGAQHNYAAIFDQGNVGIGTTTPARQLELTGQMYARNVADGDLSGPVFGKEYLYAFQKKMIDGGTPTVVLAGDSTTAGDAIGNSNYLIENLLKKIIIQNYDSVNIYNDAVSGSNTGQWLNSYLPNQIARNPDLMIIRYGINDGANNRTNFESNLRAGLALIRASRSVAQTACIVMTPNSTNDTPNGRDAAWYKTINPIMREAARDYQCTFIDTYATFFDSANGAAWYDDPYGDGRHIHPKEALNLQIAGLIADVILPKTLASVVGSTTFENPSSSYRIAAASDIVSSYSKGLSMYRATTGFPYNGQVINFRQNDGVWLQINNTYASGGLAWRTGQTSGFNAWEYPIVADANRNITGNIGLGVNPVEKLHISGIAPTIRLDESGSAVFFNSAGSALNLAINRNPGSGVFIDSSKTAAQLSMTSSTSGSKFLFYTSSTPNSLGSGDLRMSIDENGSVGIGAIPTSSKFTVYGTVDLGNDGTNLLRIENDSVSNILQSYVAGNVGRLVFNRDGGRVIVGGGTATAKANFQIAQNLAGNFVVSNSNIVQHSMEDNTKLTGSGTQNAYASYTASVQILDSTNWDHYAGFQSDLVLVGSPTITDVRAFSSNLNFNGGGSPTITNAYGAYILNPTMGSATVTNNYGVYVADLTGATNNYSIYTGNAKSYFGGYVGISQTSPSYLLHVGSNAITTGTTVARFQNGGGTCDVIPSTSGGITCSSDYNLKKNITTLSTNTPWVYQTGTTQQSDTILNKVLALQPVQYNWNTEQDTDTKHAGFIAQDVQQLFPDLVTTDPTTHLLSLNYTGLLPYTVQALQDMSVKVSAIPTYTDTTLYATISTFLDGIAQRGEATVNKVQTKELCVDDVCVTKEQFKAMVEKSAQTSNVQLEVSEPSPPVQNPEVPPEAPQIEAPVE